MCIDETHIETHIKRVKIRLHELRENSDAAELDKFLKRRKGILDVEVMADSFTVTITFDECLTTPGQIIADLGIIRLTPEGSTIVRN
jgi:hypothetical protein